MSLGRRWEDEHTRAPPPPPSSEYIPGNLYHQGPILEYFNTAGEPNQKELVGLFWAMLQVRPDRSASSLSMLIEWARWLRRHGLDSCFPKELSIVRSHIDGVMLALWQQNKREKVTPAEWWAIYSDIAQLAIAPSDIEQVLACTTNWADVAPAIQRLCDTKVGFGMFAWAQQHVVASLCAEAMCNDIRDLQAQDMTQARISEVKKKISADIEQMAGISSLPARPDGPKTRG